MNQPVQLPTWLGGIYILGEAAAIHAAQSVGLFSSLVQGSATPATHAERTRSDERVCARVLDVLVGIGLADLDERDGTYRASDVLRVWAERAPGGLATEERVWSGVPETLRTGKPAIVVDDEERARRYVDVTRRLATLLGPSADELAARIEARGPAGAAARILDIGCGSGVWSLAIARRHPQARVTGLDFAPVLETFMNAARDAQLTDRVDTIAGDALHAALEPNVYDVVLLANVLRLGPEPFWRALIERAARALATHDGARLVIVDAIGRDTPARARARGVYALHLATRTPHGDPPDEPRLRTMLGAHGLVADPVFTFRDEQAAMAAALVAKRS